MEELKNKFIVNEEYAEKIIKENMKELVQRLLPFCKIAKKGEIIIEKKGLDNVDKVALALIARYIANQLDPNIERGVSVSELAKYLIIEEKQISARAGELEKKSLIRKISRGVYEAKPSKIEAILCDLEKKNIKAG